MGRATYTHIDSQNSLTNYVQSLRPASDALRAAGLTQTPDTGQVSWATLTSVPGSGIIRDYEVFRFNDALQSTHPIFVRFDYTSDNAAPSIHVTVGTGSNGAGVITGVVAPRTKLSVSHTAGSASSATGYVSTGDNSSLTLAHGLLPSGTNSRTYTQWFALDRTRDAAGVPTNKGYTVWYGAGPEFKSSVSRITEPVGAEQPAEDVNGLLYTIPNLSTALSAFAGDTSYAFPVYSATPDPNGASQALLLSFPGDFPRGSEVQIPFQGAIRSMISLSGMVEVTVPVRSGTASVTVKTLTLLLRY